MLNIRAKLTAGDTGNAYCRGRGLTWDNSAHPGEAIGYGNPPPLISVVKFK